MFGYDWTRLHAALNDLPAALLAAAVAFEIAWMMTRRHSLRAAGFWTLLAGVLGTIAAVVAGLLAENIIEHDDVAHAVMEQHKTLALVTLGVFTLLAVWRVVRRNADKRGENIAWSLFGVTGVALLVITSQLGGSLTFNHALGIPSDTLKVVLERRGEMPMMEHGDSTMPDSARAARDSAKALHDRTPHSHSNPRRPQP